MQQNITRLMMKMDTGNKSNKVKHFQTIEKKRTNEQSTIGEKIGFSYKQRQKKTAKLVQIKKKVSCI